MGDRSNIAIEYSSGETIYLYGHWLGDDNISVISQVIHEGRRLDDESYLARIIFSKMIARDIDSDTGFGIAPYRTDDENDLITICPSKNWIEIEGEPRLTFAEFANEHALTP